MLDAQDTGCGHHPGSPPPAFVCRVVPASALAELIPEKRVIYLEFPFTRPYPMQKLRAIVEYCVLLPAVANRDLYIATA